VKEKKDSVITIYKVANKKLKEEGYITYTELAGMVGMETEIPTKKEG